MTEFPSFDLSGQTALVTGAARGLGRAIAIAGAGPCRGGCRARPAVAGTADELVAEIEAMGRKALPLKMDVTKLDEVRAAVDEAVEHFGRIDILVNNAGGGAPETPAEDVSEADFNSTVAANLKGTYFTSQAVGRIMILSRLRPAHQSGGADRRLLPRHQPLLRTRLLRQVHGPPASPALLDPDAAPLHLVRHTARLERRRPGRLPARRPRGGRPAGRLLALRRRLLRRRPGRAGRRLRRHQGRQPGHTAARRRHGHPPGRDGLREASAGPPRPRPRDRATSSTCPICTTAPRTARATGTPTSATGTSWAASSASRPTSSAGTSGGWAGWTAARWRAYGAPASTRLTLEPLGPGPAGSAGPAGADVRAGASGEGPATPGAADPGALGVAAPPGTPAFGAGRGTKLAVVPTGPGTALAFEARGTSGNDGSTCTQGVLVYRVRSGTESGGGPDPGPRRPPAHRGVLGALRLPAARGRAGGRRRELHGPRRQRPGRRRGPHRVGLVDGADHDGLNRGPDGLPRRCGRPGGGGDGGGARAAGSAAMRRGGGRGGERGVPEGERRERDARVSAIIPLSLACAARDSNPGPAD